MNQDKLDNTKKHLRKMDRKLARLDRKIAHARRSGREALRPKSEFLEPAPLYRNEEQQGESASSRPGGTKRA
jgi:hypothetical protein